MRIIFYTNTNPSIYDAYTINWFQNNLPDVTVVGINQKSPSKLAIWQNHYKRLGLWKTLLKAYDMPYLKRVRIETEARLTEILGNPKVNIDCEINAGCNSETAANTLKAFNPDVIVQAGAGILKQNIFTIAPTLNIHYGLSVRGLSSPFWSLYLNRQPGVTVHLVDEKIDHGDVLMSYPLQEKENYLKFLYLHVILGKTLLEQTLISRYRMENSESWPEDTIYKSAFTKREHKKLMRRLCQK